jgi:large subunit ribosomal protein L24
MAANSKRLKHNNIGEDGMQATKPVKDPRKQRKLLHNAPAHLRHKLMAAPLSPQLTASKSVKTLPVRKGDTVRIMRGDHKGFEGKISRVDLKNYRIYLEGLTREKVDGTTIFLPVHPSKVMIKNLNLSDKWRKAIVERKEALAKQAAKAVEKPKKKAKKAEKPPAKVAKVEKEVKPAAVEEKPAKAKVKAAEAKAAVAEKPAKAKPEVKPVAKPATKSVAASTKAKKKPAAKKKQAAASTKKKKPAAKEKKPKAAKTAKKTRTTRKAASKAKAGGK